MGNTESGMENGGSCVEVLGDDERYGSFGPSLPHSEFPIPYSLFRDRQPATLAGWPPLLMGRRVCCLFSTFFAILRSISRQTLQPREHCQP